MDYSVKLHLLQLIDSEIAENNQDISNNQIWKNASTDNESVQEFERYIKKLTQCNNYLLKIRDLIESEEL